MAGRQGHVLIIEDDDPLRNMLRRVLSPEHEVTALARAQEALDRIIAGERFDLILCDLMLPGMTGMELYERVGRVAPGLVDRIVFTSAGAFTERAQAFIKRPDIRHMEKPFLSMDVLRENVRKYIDSAVQDRS